MSAQINCLDNTAVADVQALAGQIDFGDVEKIEGRVIHLKVSKDAFH